MTNKAKQKRDQSTGQFYSSDKGESKYFKDAVSFLRVTNLRKEVKKVSKKLDSNKIAS